jgi:inner membrane protein
MPSPLAHSMMGYTIYRAIRPYSPKENGLSSRSISPLLLGTIVLSMLPDLDAIPGLLFNDFRQFHNNVSHSLIIGLVVALGIGGLVWMRRRSDFKRWFTLALVCYELHILMDFLTVGERGALLFWPLSPDRFRSPVKLFYGVRWSEGLISGHHLWTVVTELGFVICLALLICFFLDKEPRRAMLKK